MRVCARSLARSLADPPARAFKLVATESRTRDTRGLRRPVCTRLSWTASLCSPPGTSPGTWPVGGPTWTALSAKRKRCGTSLGAVADVRPQEAAASKRVVVVVRSGFVSGECFCVIFADGLSLISQLRAGVDCSPPKKAVYAESIALCRGGG